MYSDIPIWLAAAFIVTGLAVLAWSADAFVASAGTIARALGVSPFIIGMLIIGFGTSAPELCVSALSGASGHGGLSLGNAYGSCIFNIAVILGVSALIKPIVVRPGVAATAAAILAAVSVFSFFLSWCGNGFSRLDGIVSIASFLAVMPLYCTLDRKLKPEEAAARDARPTAAGGGGTVAGGRRFPVRAAIMLAVSLALLAGSSHMLVWGCVATARALGVSDLLIGLTVVAAGTSLPELASAVASARRGEHEFVLGNIVGSNLFNTLAVVGIAGTLSPFAGIGANVLWRDLPVMIALSLSICAFGTRWRDFRSSGCVTRAEGLVWIAAFLAYSAVLLAQEIRH